MLLSQRIAKDLHHLKRQNATSMELFDLRLQIIQAVKIIVPTTILAVNDPDDGHLASILQSFNSKGKKLPASKIEENKQKKYEHYVKFARVPFPTVFLENDDCGILIWKVDNAAKSFRFTAIMPDGFCVPQDVCVQLSLEDESINLNMDMKRHERVNAGYLKNDAVINWSLAAAIQVMESLLFMNTKNVTMHTYSPTKREHTPVPKPLRRHFTYRVLDLFHEVTKYNSLNGIVEHMASIYARRKELRTHVVRGHHKERKTGVFWWSDYTRCLKNRDTLGEIEKDYRLNE